MLCEFQTIFILESGSAEIKRTRADPVPQHCLQGLKTETLYNSAILFSSNTSHGFSNKLKYNYIFFLQGKYDFGAIF